MGAGCAGAANRKGRAKQETVYLDDTPVAVLRGKHIDYSYADHLDTPRVIVNRANKVIWRWDSDPFGNSSARKGKEDDDDEDENEDEGGDDGEFTYNLRFPGQYFDKETGLHYNYFRDYDPGTGRYVESDPIGLAGGLNTYAYAGGNPVNYYDPDGLSLTSAVVGSLPAMCRVNPVACARVGISLPKTPVPVPVAAVVGAGAAGYAVGSMIYPQIAQPLGRVIDTAVKICSGRNDDKPDCRKASKWDLLQAGINDEHAYKREHGAVPESRFDICKCKDGSIRIARVGQCGKTRDFWN